MKTINIIKAMTAAVLIIAGTNTYAQRGWGYGWGADCPRGYGNGGYGNGQGPGRGMMWQDDLGLPDVSDQQIEAIEQARVEHFKTMKDMRNKLGEKEARMRTLMSSPKGKEAEIDQLTEEMGALKTEMMKERNAYHLHLRSLLTEDQQAVFDARPKPGRGYGQGYGRGPGRGMGPCGWK
jgi:Spy/CpxP family protein refolding chaperone